MVFVGLAQKILKHQSVLGWHKSRAQITMINKIGERKTSIKRQIGLGLSKKKKPWYLD